MKRKIDKLTIILSFIILICVFLCVSVVFGKTSLHWLGGSVFTLFFLVILINFIKLARKIELKESKNGIDYLENDTLTDSLNEGLRIFKLTLKGSPIYTFVLFGTCEVLAADITAAAIPVENLTNFITTVHISNGIANAPDAVIASDISSVKCDYILERILSEGARAELPSKDAPPELRKITLLEQDRNLSIDENTRKKLFFQNKTWNIPEDADSTIAANIIHDFIDFQVAKSAPNNFALIAPDKVMDSVSEASNKEIWTSADLDDVLEVHEAAYYAGYDCFTLTNLISNSYYGYGLAYFDQTQMTNTIEYYLLTSIQWRFESLTYYTLSHKQISKILRSISQAYYDISIISNLNPSSKARSSLLSDAFELVSNDYL